MNRIVFVGNSDSIMKNISKDLSREFDVKICPAEIDSIREVFEVQRPELVVVSTSGFEMDHGAVYALLRDEYSHLPVLSVGTKAELKMFADYTQSEQFRELQRPVPVGKIVYACCILLGVTPPKNICYEDMDCIGPAIKTVMLIDDNPVDLRTLRMVLKDHYRVLLAPSGIAAVGIMQKEIPNLIFLDYDMPVVNGKMTLELIRNNPTLRDIPVVFLTGVNDKERIMSVMQLNPADYLLKPVDHDKILETVKRIIG